MAPAAAAAPAAPTARADRIEALDILRGFALSGILFVNIETLSGYDLLSASQAQALPGAALDAAVRFLVAWLVHAKFYSLFSLLFGVGFAIFMQRAEARGAAAGPLFRRRLVGLLLIGLVHSVLLWFGDILHVYALLGFFLLPFYRASARTILRWSLLCLGLPIVLHGLLVVGAAVAGTPAGAPTTAARPEIITRGIEAFRAGTYPQVVGANLVFTAVGFIVRRVLQMQALRIFGMFLLGFFLVRQGWLTANVDARRATLAHVVRWGFLVGLPAGAGAALLPAPRLLPAATLAGWAGTTCEAVGALALALAYAASVLLLVEKPAWHARLAPLAPFGRAALSNYVLQTVACVAVFYGIGLGLFMRVGLGYVFLVAAAIVAAQLIASRFWLARFAYGPAEWVWRQFTYGRPGMTLARGRAAS